MKLILEEAIRERAIRVDLAWTLFFEKSTIPDGHGGRLIPFTNWLWDELGKKAGNLNRNSSSELTLTIPSLSEQGMDFLLRLVSDARRIGNPQIQRQRNRRPSGGPDRKANGAG